MFYDGRTMSDVLKTIKKVFPEAVRDVSMAKQTTFGIGGKVLAYLIVTTPESFLEAVALARQYQIPHQIIAGGSNVVFPDKAFRGLVIRYHNPQGVISSKTDDGLLIISDAGVPLSKLIDYSLSLGLGGLETLSGIPGTVGGAIVGNAGAYGQSISDTLLAVQIWDGYRLRWLKKSNCKFHYRDSIFKHRSWLVLRARFKLFLGNKRQLKTKSASIIKTRNLKYKPGILCPGSFFKNVLVAKVPKRSLKLIDQTRIIDGKIPAGYLLEAVGAKGMKVGKVSIADFHGNLFVNQGQATYREVRLLANRVRRLVYKKFGITLEEEVRYVI